MLSQGAAAWRACASKRLAASRHRKPVAACCLSSRPGNRDARGGRSKPARDIGRRDARSASPGQGLRGKSSSRVSEPGFAGGGRSQGHNLSAQNHPSAAASTSLAKPWPHSTTRRPPPRLPTHNGVRRDRTAATAILEPGGSSAGGGAGGFQPPIFPYKNGAVSPWGRSPGAVTPQAVYRQPLPWKPEAAALPPSPLPSANTEAGREVDLDKLLEQYALDNIVKKPSQPQPAPVQQQRAQEELFASMPQVVKAAPASNRQSLGLRGPAWPTATDSVVPAPGGWAPAAVAPRAPAAPSTAAVEAAVAEAAASWAVPVPVASRRPAAGMAPQAKAAAAAEAPRAGAAAAVAPPRPATSAPSQAAAAAASAATEPFPQYNMADLRAVLKDVREQLDAIPVWDDDADDLFGTSAALPLPAKTKPRIGMPPPPPPPDPRWAGPRRSPYPETGFSPGFSAGGDMAKSSKAAAAAAAAARAAAAKAVAARARAPSAPRTAGTPLARMAPPHGAAEAPEIQMAATAPAAAATTAAPAAAKARKPVTAYTYAAAAPGFLKRRAQLSLPSLPLSQRVTLSGEPIAVRDLARQLSRRTDQLVHRLRRLGERQATEETVLDPDTAELLCDDLGFQVMRTAAVEWDVFQTPVPTGEAYAALPVRPPVVAVMGHVDHGKTTLLDALRRTDVAAGEEAGITQCISAFSVPLAPPPRPVDAAAYPGVSEAARPDAGAAAAAAGSDTGAVGAAATAAVKTVTFFDTPGHAAFGAMRRSGAMLTDVVVVVVAAEDGLKPQTLEVLQLLRQYPHMQAVVAVTKIDRLPDEDAVAAALASIDDQLEGQGLLTEAKGGDIPVVGVSGVTGQGLAELVETIALQAEVMELHADAEAPGEGVVIDSAVEKGNGCVADVLVTWGALRDGAHVVVGTQYGRVKRMIGSGGGDGSAAVTGSAKANGKNGKNGNGNVGGSSNGGNGGGVGGLCAGPVLASASVGQAVRVTGLRGVPEVGDCMLTVDSEEQARRIVERRLAVRQVREDAARAAKEWDRAQARSEARAGGEPAKETGPKRRRWVRREIPTDENGACDGSSDDDGAPARLMPALFKAEGHGVLAAMHEVLEEVPDDEICVQIVHAGVGPVTRADVERAAVTGGDIWTFNVGVASPDVRALARAERVVIRPHRVIYRFLEDVRERLGERLGMMREVRSLGRAEVLKVFPARSGLAVAGCRVIDGKLLQGRRFRVLRRSAGGNAAAEEPEVVHDAERAASMRHFKDKVSEAVKGQECGIALEGFSDFREGDVIESYEYEDVQRTV